MSLTQSLKARLKTIYYYLSEITTTTKWMGLGFIMDVRRTIKCSGGTAVASILNERTGGAESGSFTIRIIGIVSVAGEWRARWFTPAEHRGGMKWRCAKLRCLCHPHQGAELLWATAIPCSASRRRIRCKENFSSACIHSFWIETSNREPSWKRERVESTLRAPQDASRWNQF